MVLCPSCRFENREDATFCAECGATLAKEVACAACGRSMPIGRKFCDGCGQRLTDAAPSARTPTPAPSPALPTSFADGRYQVKRVLGEGGRKRVYLAHDTKLDSDVAFALVKTEGLDADSLTRVRREAQAMGRLRDHPNIVTVFDIGDENGQPYIVSQHMAGGDLEGMLREAENHRLPIDQAVRIAMQVCKALEHAHSRGIIHRDLKPGNIWLSDDGDAKLGDFGLAVALDRSRLTMEGMMVGTVAYMPPEQALGRQPDARSDLYSLGCVLYEIVTGRPPYLGDDVVAIISQHINTAPITPSWHNPQLPPSVNDLIQRLLAKAPEERPDSAAAVAEELSRLQDISTEEPTEPPPAAAAIGLQGIARAPFAGRRREMDQLKTALEETLSGRGSLITLVGEPGIGKTRLAEEFAVYASLRGAQVLSGRCYEGETAVPYLPFVEALQQYARGRGDEVLREELGDGAPEVARLVSEVRQRFPDIPEAPPLDDEAERLRLFESVANFLRNAATANPLIVFLDDIHWADKPSLLLLRHLARRLSSDRVLIVGAYRDVELDRTHPLAEVIAALRQERLYQRILLRGLPEEDVLALLTAMEPSEESSAGRQALAAALYQETEGNPFFIHEVISHLIEEGKLVREGGRWIAKVTSVSELGIPEGVREVVGRRLSRLTEGCNRILTLTSTMTGGFSWETLKAISGEDEETLVDLLEEALGAQLIQERKGDQGSIYDFTHALIRQTLYGELSTPRRVILHRQIGEALERVHGDNLEPHLAELAHHFYQAAPGGDVEKAIDYARRAGDRVAASVAYEEAARLYKMALQGLDFLDRPNEHLRCEILLALGDAQTRGGQGDEAVPALEQAFELAERLNDVGLIADVALAYPQAVFRSSRAFTKAPVPVLRRALERVGTEHSAHRAYLLMELAGQLMSDEFEEGMVLVREAVDIAARVRDQRAILKTQRALLTFLLGPDHLAERSELSKEVVSLAVELGDKHEEAWGRVHLMVNLLTMGDIEGTDAELAAIFPLAEQTREPLYMGWRAFWSGMRASMQGTWAEVERSAQEALVIYQRFQLPVYFLSWASLMYDMRRFQGRLAELEGPLRTTIQQNPALAAAWQGPLALVHCESGKDEEAREILEQLAVNGFEDIPRDWIWLTNIHLLIYVARHLRDRERARILYDLLLPYRNQNIVPGYAILYVGSASGALGVAAAALGEWDTAEQHFDEAIEMEQRTGARPWLARWQYEYAAMLVSRDGPGDREKAVALLAEALDTAQEFEMKKEVEKALALKLQLQGISSTDVKTSIDAVASAVYVDKPDLSPHAAPDGTVTILFSDIEGSTAITERLGDQRWLELLREHNAIVREHVAAHEGFEVKSEGDGFMLAFGSARRALECAADIQRAFAARNESAEEPIRVRIGLHTGEAIKEADDFYGKNVILAARIAGQAQGGEILVSSLLKELTESGGDIEFGDGREVELKGLTGAHQLFEVHWVSGGVGGEGR